MTSMFRAVAIAGLFVALAADVHAQPAPLERLSVMSDGHPMAVWARRPSSPRAAILLVHGRTWSSRPDFDLQVPGLQRSVLVSLAAQGISAYAIDLRGYGETRRDASGWLTPRRSAADVVNVLAWVAQQHPSLPRPSLLGWSLGAAVAMLAAQTTPQRLSSLIVFGFSHDPDFSWVDSQVGTKPAMRKNTAAAAAEDFISPRVTPRAVVDAFVAQALRSDPIAMDLRNDSEFNAINLRRLTMPILVLYGERDVNVPPDEGAAFFKRLGAKDKQMVQLPGADHVAQLEDTHEAWVAAVVSFITKAPGRR